MNELLELADSLRDERLTQTRLADGSGVILDLESLQVLSLNDTGMFLVERLKAGARTVGELTTALCDEFEVDAEAARRDVDQFLQALREQLRP